jgi:hypothetical protein
MPRQSHALEQTDNMPLHAALWKQVAERWDFAYRLQASVKTPQQAAIQEHAKARSKKSLFMPAMHVHKSHRLHAPIELS